MPACLRMVFAAHGVDVSEADIRAACDCTLAGTDALHAVDAARRYGFQQSAKHTLTLEEIAVLVEGGIYPIVFVSLKPIDGVRDTHALVVTYVGERFVTVCDPLQGVRTLPERTFFMAWALRHNLSIVIAR
ncbi:MAG: cysteine peptidase family C39 domain-containing protein [Pyrinomonadaceae bacterium]